MRAWLRGTAWVLSAFVSAGLFGASPAEDTFMKPLTPEEAAVILHKGTERPFTGRYNEHFEKGVYACRQCGAALFASGDKFRSECGWPSFDDALPGTVKRLPDADGRRVEIVCANCGGHLGHVFAGEKLTPKDMRYCVNSISMVFVPQKDIQCAVVAGGCFWGVEALMRAQKGVLSVESGYTGGTVPNPTYEQVCAGNTGHYEAVRVCFDSRAISYEDVLKRFFEIHDFSQKDGQGPDIGLQYRSAVFYADETQKKQAEQIMEWLRQKGYVVATQLLPQKPFYPAEDYHQRYYERTGKQPYCHRHRPIFQNLAHGAL